MATKAPPSKGGVLGSKVHGVPTIAIVAGGGVVLYLLYKHFSSSSSSSTPSSTSVPAYYPSGNPPSNSNGSSGGGSSGGYGPTGHRTKGRKGGQRRCPRGQQWVEGYLCGPGYGYTQGHCWTPGTMLSCGPKTSSGTSTSSVPAASPTSIPVVTPKSAAAGQAQLVSANQAKSAGVTPAATKAYNQLTSNSAWAAQPQSVVARTAAQTAAGTGNGPNAYYGEPGSSSTLTTAQISSMNARNHVNPNLGNATQQEIAATAAQNPQDFGGGWTQNANGTITNQATGQTLAVHWVNGNPVYS